MLTNRPTFAQEQYAEALVKRLREAQLLEAESYTRKVMRCQDRAEMSSLIDAMLAALNDLAESGKHFGIR